MEHSTNKSSECEFVVACDISEFYPRLGYHRLENALEQVAGDTAYPRKIMEFLTNYSINRSFGLPIGGPAARILSEITINQIDRLLIGNDISFARFADDYHVFAKSREDAYRHLIFLSEKLFNNQGLSLQKSKTRIITSAEFRSTNPLKIQEIERGSEDGEPKSELFEIYLRFDPYSRTAKDDYEKILKREIRKFDIIKLLKEELAKSRVHTALSRKIVGAIRYLEGSIKDDAVLSILDNSDVLYPIFSSVLLMIEQVFEDLLDETKKIVVSELKKLIRSNSHILRVDVHLGYAIQVLAHVNTPDCQSLLQQIYEERTSPIIRRDIILALAKLGEWYWLSDLKNRFRELSGPERRAFLLASYVLKDEGDHWRKNIKEELNPYESFILKWAGEKAGQKNWSIPL